MTTDSLIDNGFRLDDWCVEPRLGRMIRGQVVITLRPRVMDALVVLAASSGKVVTKRELVDQVWSAGYVADNTVVHCINEIREALGETGSKSRLLQTVPRRGYRLLALVSPIGDIASVHAIDGARYQLVSDRWVAYLLDGNNLVGRGGESRILAPSVRVSRHHAEIRVNGAEVVVADLGSKNGTFVGDRRITGATSVEDGDTIKFADVSVVFCQRATGGLYRTETMDPD
jgi:DNA-binding winged helix-turn-helix (wHTH) protein